MAITVKDAIASIPTTWRQVLTNMNINVELPDDDTFNAFKHFDVDETKAVVISSDPLCKSDLENVSFPISGPDIYTDLARRHYVLILNRQHNFTEDVVIYLLENKNHIVYFNLCDYSIPSTECNCILKSFDISACNEYLMKHSIPRLSINNQYILPYHKRSMPIPIPKRNNNR